MLSSAPGVFLEILEQLRALPTLVSSRACRQNTGAWPSLFYAGIRLPDIYVVHDWSPCQIKPSQWHKLLPCLGRKLATLQVWPWPLTKFIGHRCHQHFSLLTRSWLRKHQKCRVIVATAKRTIPLLLHIRATLLVHIREHVVGDFKLHKKIRKNSDMLDFSSGCCGASLKIGSDAQNWSATTKCVQIGLNSCSLIPALIQLTTPKVTLFVWYLQ